MELEKFLTFKINDWKCEFRTLNEIDVSQNYINALKRNNFLEKIPQKLNLKTQKKYINEILSREDETICGLYIDKRLVGSCGMQTYSTFLHNIDTKKLNVATIGIFLFDNNFKGIGLGKVILWASIFLLHECSRVEWFTAGMLKDNIASLKTFLSCGFKQEEFNLSQRLLVTKEKYLDENLEVYNVLLKYSELIKPNLIHNKKIITV